MSTRKQEYPFLITVAFLVFLLALAVIDAMSKRNMVESFNTITQDGVQVSVSVDVSNMDAEQRAEIRNIIDRKVSLMSVINSNNQLTYVALTLDMVTVTVRVDFLENISDTQLIEVRQVIRTAGVLFMFTERNKMAIHIDKKLESLNIATRSIMISSVDDIVE